MQWYFLKLAGAVVLMALFFAEVLNRHRQRRGATESGTELEPLLDPDEPEEPPANDATDSQKKSEPTVSQP
jgi:hypothetical protein